MSIAKISRSEEFGQKSSFPDSPLMIRIGPAHQIPEEEPKTEERAAREIMEELASEGFTCVAFDPSTGVAGAVEADIRPGCLTDFVPIHLHGELNPEAISFVIEASKI